MGVGRKLATGSQRDMARRRSEVLRLWESGMPTKRIQELTGFASTNWIKTLVCNARKNGDKRAVWRKRGRPRKSAVS